MSKAPPSACWPAASPPPSGCGETPAPPPATTAMGALLRHITGGADAATFQPMNVNFGLFPPIDGTFRGKERKQALSRAGAARFRSLARAEPLAAD